MKGIVFTKEMLDARNNEATMFVIPIDEKYSKKISKIKTKDGLECFIDLKSPLQKGDEFFIQEDFYELSELHNEDFSYLIDNNPRKDIGLYVYKSEYSTSIQNEYISWEEASQMQEYQSRYKDVCLDVEVKRVQDLNPDDWYSLGLRMSVPHSDVMWERIVEYFEDTYNLKWKDNPYLFIYTVKGIS